MKYHVFKTVGDFIILKREYKINTDQLPVYYLSKDEILK